MSLSTKTSPFLNSLNLDNAKITVSITPLDGQGQVWVSCHETASKKEAVEQSIREMFQHDGSAGLWVSAKSSEKSGRRVGQIMLHGANYLCKSETMSGRYAIECQTGGFREFRVWTKSYFESKSQMFPSSSDFLGHILAMKSADVGSKLASIGIDPRDHRWEEQKGW